MNFQFVYVTLVILWIQAIELFSYWLFFGHGSNVNLPEKEAGTSLADLLTELTSLKERNKSMERELQEMQERYLEMSLNFAEVEGERQKLVMTVRNLQKG